jgi:hypothetical protein
LLVAVHAHEAGAVTATVLAPPSTTTCLLVGAMAYVQATAAAAWLTKKVWPAMVMVLVRAAPLLAATLKLTAPLPLPAAPLVTVIQGALLTAVQAQPVPAVTAIGVPAPPLAGAF